MANKKDKIQFLKSIDKLIQSHHLKVNESH